MLPEMDTGSGTAEVDQVLTTGDDDEPDGPEEDREAEDIDDESSYLSDGDLSLIENLVSILKEDQDLIRDAEGGDVDRHTLCGKNINIQVTFSWQLFHPVQLGPGL